MSACLTLLAFLDTTHATLADISSLGWLLGILTSHWLQCDYNGDLAFLILLRHQRSPMVTP